MIRAYLYALDPTDAQASAFRSHCGAQRVAYNWCLAQVKANWAQRAAEQTYGLTGDQLTGWTNTSAYGLRKAWNAAKAQVAPWWAENSKEAYASGCANLATALGNR
ncbi:MAG: helix-turn-helix domain-containing protein, partial [Sciscionella sp.]